MSITLGRIKLDRYGNVETVYKGEGTRYRNIESDFTGDQSLNDLAITKLIECLIGKINPQPYHDGAMFIEGTDENQYWLIVKLLESGEVEIEVGEPAA